MNLTGAARLAGIIGWPVAQSLSPRLHGYWLNELAIDGAYVPLAVRPEDFSTVVVGIRKAGFAGVNVTVPHKESAFALCHDCDSAARAAGAVNLLVFHGDGRIEGRNTDAPGLAGSLRAELGGDAVSGKPAVILGAGGAARAAVVALQEMGAGEIRIVNRSRGRADRLAHEVAP
jgi:shikimate dehydrogenase